MNTTEGNVTPKIKKSQRIYTDKRTKMLNPNTQEAGAGEEAGKLLCVQGQFDLPRALS